MPAGPSLSQLYRTMVLIRRFEERCVIAHEAVRTGGFGGELAALVAGADVPLPYSRPLENAALPSSDTIAAALLAVVERSEIA